jgi:urease accessory protein UreF
MLNPADSGTTELLGDWHPLVQQLGSTEGLVTLSTASHWLRLKKVDNLDTLQRFLEAYQSQVLIPFELPAIQRAFRHASRNETRELIALIRKSREQLIEPLPQPAAASARPTPPFASVADHRLLQRYLRAVEAGQAHGWHTLVYGVTLSSIRCRSSKRLFSYERQTLLGFMHAVARRLRLSEQACRNPIEELTPGLPRVMEGLLDDDALRAPKFDF